MTLFPPLSMYFETKPATEKYFASTYMSGPPKFEDLATQMKLMCPSTYPGEPGICEDALNRDARRHRSRLDSTQLDVDISEAEGRGAEGGRMSRQIESPIRVGGKEMRHKALDRSLYPPIQMILLIIGDI